MNGITEVIIICLFVTSNLSSFIKFPAEWLSKKILLYDINDPQNDCLKDAVQYDAVQYYNQ